eukprot:TRINITY_DN65543_c0_g1_i1.p1 TRINITY_DN65543_c0_g1~~TRINITY_DN65543_c0_g1_i1.p1  ORF type:complete len:303 (+),score=45.02 TRINITY_DN65543_c0_g1_i1:343-1251(+)
MNQKKPIPTSTISQRIDQELECNKKLINIYENELKSLNKQLVSQTGVARVAELEEKYKETEKTFQELQQTRKDLEVNIKNTGKVFGKESEKAERNVTQLEEEAIFGLLKTEREKGKVLESRLLQENETNTKKHGKIMKLEKKIKELEEELALLKKNNQGVFYKNGKAKEETHKGENLEGELSKLTQELRVNIKQNNQKRQDLKSELNALKDTFGVLEKVQQSDYVQRVQKNKLNSAKVAEYTMIVKNQNVKRPLGTVQIVSKKQEAITERMNRVKKYHKLKLKRRYPVLFFFIQTKHSLKRY